MTPEEILKQQIESAPQEIKEFLANKGWVPALDSIATNSGLTAEQKSAVENEIIFVLVGMDLESNLKTNLQNIGLSDTMAKFVFAQIDTKIMDRFKRDLPTSTEEEPSKAQFTIEKSSPESYTSPPPSNLPVVEEHEPVPMVVNKPVINKPIIDKPIIDKIEPVEAPVREVSTYQATINKLFTRPATPGMTGMANSTPPTKNLNLIDSIKPSVPATPPPPPAPQTSAPKAPTPEEPKLYPRGKDPYREPLE